MPYTPRDSRIFVFFFSLFVVIHCFSVARNAKMVPNGGSLCRAATTTNHYFIDEIRSWTQIVYIVQRSTWQFSFSSPFRLLWLETRATRQSAFRVITGSQMYVWHGAYIIRHDIWQAGRSITEFGWLASAMRSDMPYSLWLSKNTLKNYKTNWQNYSFNFQTSMLAIL